MKVLFTFLLTVLFTVNVFALNKANVMGANVDVDTGAAEDVWTQGGLYAFPTVAAATKILSSSANDTSAGTGARTVRVFGLDSNFQIQQEDAIMNGTTDVILVKSYLRILSAQVLTAGSGATNAGAITVQQSTTVLAAIVAAEGRSRMAVYTASKINSHIIKKIYVAATNAIAGSVKAQLLTRKQGGVWQIRFETSVYGTTNSSAYIDLGAPINLDVGEDARILATVTTDNTAVAAGFDVLSSSTPLDL